MDNINLSIIIPHYNSPNSLMNLLNSIFDECRNDVEVLVIDDNSDKDLIEYNKCMDLFREKNAYFFINSSKTKGAGGARNVGLDHSRGKWILFADADDYFLNGWYEQTKKYFKSQYDVIFFYPTSKNLKTMQAGKRELPYVNLLNNVIDGAKNAECGLRYCFYAPWSKMIKRKLIDFYNIRFDCTMYSNDVMFSTKLGYNMKSFCIDKNFIYCVTEGEKTLITNKSKEAFFIRIQVEVERYIFLKERLKQDDWKFLRVKNTNLMILHATLKRGYGIKFFLKVYRYLKEKNIPLITKYTFLIPFEKGNSIFK